MRVRLLAMLLLLGCGGRDTVVDEHTELRQQLGKVIDRGSIDDAEALIAKTTLAKLDRALLEQLADLYRQRWEVSKPHTVRVIESFQQGESCARVSQDLTFPDPVALRTTLVKELTRGRELYRAACNFRYAYEASAWLGDHAGYEADIAALHREAKDKACARFAFEPTADHDAVGIELAFAADASNDQAIEAAIARTLARTQPSPLPAVACRTRLARAYLAERAGDYARAAALYAEVPAPDPTTIDDCFDSARARREAGPAAPSTKVSGKLTVPPATTIRLAFQAVPKVAPGTTPSIFGNGTSIRHPWPDRAQYFYIDATIAGGRFEATLPPGFWLPQIEIDFAGKWTLGEVSPCLTVVEARADLPAITLPDLAFEPVR